METYQLKKIIIIILALVNLALLGLLGHNELQQRGTEQEVLKELKTLYASSGVELALDDLPSSGRHVTAEVVSNGEMEAAFAEALLGDTTAQESGSAMLYTSESGTLRFRQNGFFELTLTRPFLSREETLSLLSDFGYALSDGGAGDTLRLTQTLSDKVIAEGNLFLIFRDGLLQSASGYYVCGLQEKEEKDLCSAADALSAFLRYVQENGVVCGSVRSVRPAWQLSAETLFHSALLPVWLIETDASCYYAGPSGSQIAPLFAA